MLAHPLLYHLTPDGVRELVARLKAAGLGGIEAIYVLQCDINTGIPKPPDHFFVACVAAADRLVKSGCESGVGRFDKEAEVRELVARLKAAGLGGIEAIYSANTGSDEGFVRQLAAQYGLRTAFYIAVQLKKTGEMGARDHRVLCFELQVLNTG